MGHVRQRSAKDDRTCEHAVGDRVDRRRLSGVAEVDELEGGDGALDGEQRLGRRHAGPGERAPHHQGHLRFHDEANEVARRDFCATRIDTGAEEEPARGPVGRERLLRRPAREPGLPPDDALAAGEERLAHGVLHVVGVGERQRMPFAR